MLNVIASWSANVRDFLLDRFHDYDKMMKKQRLHKICNKFLK